MALLTVFSNDSDVHRAARTALGPDSSHAHAGAWDRLLALVAERPTTGVVIDAERLTPEAREPALVDLAARFPSVWVVLITRASLDPMTLFSLGRRGIRGLVLTRLDDVFAGSVDAIRRASKTTTEALVARLMSPYLPARESRTVRLAMRGVQLGWTTDELAGATGLSRAHLSVRLRSVGLPSAGHLLIWARLLHAGRWLSDPGRSAESVSRQLDYANGATFRRALRNYLGVTPTELRASGGLAPVLRAFARTCGLEEERTDDRSAA